MLDSIRNLMDFRLMAKDGEFGKITDVFFDARRKMLLYLIIYTSDWLPDRSLAIPYEIISHSTKNGNILNLPYSREQILRKWVRGSIGKYTPFGVATPENRAG